MEGLNRRYWMRHRAKVITGALVGFSAIAFVMTTPSNSRGIVLTILVIQVLLCSPFILKTAIGRLWWGSSVTGIGVGTGAVLLGPYNPFGWVLALVAAFAFGIGVCLRWHPPANATSKVSV